MVNKDLFLYYIRKCSTTSTTRVLIFRDFSRKRGQHKIVLTKSMCFNSYYSLNS